MHPDSSDDELMERLLGERRGRGNGPKGRGEAGGNDSDEGSEDEEEEDERKVIGGLQAFEDSKEQEFKLVLVVRTDLGMQKGMYINPIFPFYWSFNRRYTSVARFNDLICIILLTSLLSPHR